jgi:hypothetical protein
VSRTAACSFPSPGACLPSRRGAAQASSRIEHAANVLDLHPTAASLRLIVGAEHCASIVESDVTDAVRIVGGRRSQPTNRPRCSKHTVRQSIT